MRDFIGLNGHTVQFKPDLYQPVCRLVRDYHPVEWDLQKETSILPTFPFAKNKVDWDKVYGTWKNHGWTTDACLMFETIPQTNWKDLERDIAAYGNAFAREFGPSGKRKLVESVEIGNEPGKWSDDEYSRVFRYMATAIRAGDPKMKIATCNLTTGKSGDYEKSVACISKQPDLVDVLTLHSYAQLTGWPTWKRSFPEDPALPKYLKDIADLCAWRENHMPGKPVWITEFGYDCTTRAEEKSGDFSKMEFVSDEQQAQWIVRSLLVFSSMPVDRAYIYFFNDEDQPSLHAGSGLTRHFKPKPSYHAVSHLYKTLGDYRFQRIVTNETGKLRVHEYQNASNPQLLAWVAWIPAGENDMKKFVLTDVPGKLVSSTRMPLTNSTDEAATALQRQAGTVDVMLDGSPVYLFLKK
ncbi:MAG: hypothetical protein H8M99_09995 [Gloeobacteraceae cyanobacterium ES-bin-144]|nr:hypothetical protein [Verrucomicrobiales bacterium]